MEHSDMRSSSRFSIKTVRASGANTGKSVRLCPARLRMKLVLCRCELDGMSLMNVFASDA